MKIRRFLILLAALIFVFLFSACKTDTGDKKIVVSNSLWPEYTFEEACDEAARIIIGTVSSLNRTYVTRVMERPLSDGSYVELGYTVLNIEVEETLKGEHQDTIEYIQKGCETEDRIFMPDSFALSIGDRVLVFIGGNKLMLTPAFLLHIDEDNNVTTNYLPENYPAAFSASNEIDVEEYAGLIRDCLAG